MKFELKQLNTHDIVLFEDLMTVFGQAFNEMHVYTDNRPDHDYVRDLLTSDNFIALACLHNEKVVGGLTAYELKKFEQQCSEIYIYDLAVISEYRRLGIATSLINRMKHIAAQRGAYVLIIEADTGEEDQPAIALYRKLGKEEKMLHFDIPVDKKQVAK